MIASPALNFSMLPRLADPQPAPAPAPEPAPAPAPAPTDGVDLSSVDTPVKAAQLAILDPAVLTGIVVGALAGSMGGHPGLAYIDATLLTGTGAQDRPAGTDNGQQHNNYIIDPKNQDKPITMGGVVGPKFASNSLRVDQKSQSAHWSGTDGDVTISADQKGKAIHIDGLLGSVDTHLTLTGGTNQSDTINVHTEGTLGGVAYVADTLLQANPKSTRDSIQATLTERGHLGDALISKDYQLTAFQGKDGQLSFSAQGQGVNAGVPETVSVSLRLGK